MTTLLPMRPERFASYLEAAIAGYAQDNVSAGASGIGLNVFAGNTGAQALYRKLGYVTTNFNMSKLLG